MQNSLSLINPEYDATHKAISARLRLAEADADPKAYDAIAAALALTVQEETRRMIAVYRKRQEMTLKRLLIGQDVKHLASLQAPIRFYHVGPSATFNYQTHLGLWAANGIEAAKVFRDMMPRHAGPVMVRKVA